MASSHPIAAHSTSDCSSIISRFSMLKLISFAMLWIFFLSPIKMGWIRLISAASLTDSKTDFWLAHTTADETLGVFNAIDISGKLLKNKKLTLLM